MWCKNEPQKFHIYHTFSVACIYKNITLYCKNATFQEHNHARKNDILTFLFKLTCFTENSLE